MVERNGVGRGGFVLMLAMAAGCGGSASDGQPQPDVRADEPPVVVSPPGSRPSPTPPPAAGLPSATPPATPPSTAGVLASGSFVDKDEHGTGTALAVRDASGALFLRLEGLDVAAGPALHVLLTNQASPSTRADVEAGMLDLGVLRANKGNLTYPIPGGTAVSTFAGVVIYCAEYHVVFAAATLVPR